MLNQEFQNRSSSLKRGLGLFLVVFILYGTTVEAVHRHGRILPNHEVTSVNAEQTTSPASGKTGCSDCLICQLHQNFTTTLVAFRLVDPPSGFRLKITSAVPRDVHSQMAGPTAGRAPPSIS